MGGDNDDNLSELSGVRFIVLLEIQNVSFKSFEFSQRFYFCTVEFQICLT